MVKWSSQSSEAQNLFNGMGIEFLSPDSEVQRLIREFAERERKKLGLEG